MSSAATTTSTKNNEGSKTQSLSNSRNNNGAQGQSSDFEQLLDEVTSAVVTYSKRQPKAIACGIFVLGFMIGWKIKPW